MSEHVEERRQVDPARPSGPNWALLAFVVSVAALIVAGASWYQSRAAVEAMRAGRPGAAAEDAGGGRSPIIDLAGAPYLGADAARVALVEFSDYECPFCIRHFRQTMPQIEATYVKTGRVRYVFRDWPVDQLHPESIRAHAAAHCAGEQQRYWILHARLFGPAGSHSRDRLLDLAREAGLDMAAFGACLDSRRSDAAIRQTSRMAAEFGASGTPAFFIGVRDPATDKVTVLQGLAGAQPYDVFAQAIDAVLEKAR
jgi:protein-disulfide isomerase